jgi:hypothetical protein
VEKLTARLGRVEAKIAEVEPKASAAVIEGKVLNGKVPELFGLRFERDELTKEIKRLSDDELPAARAAEDEARRRGHLATARMVHSKTRTPAAAKIDAALASVEKALTELQAAQRGYAVAMDAAGHRQQTLHWQDLLRRVVWKQAPEVARLLGLSVVLRHHGSTMAEVIDARAPPGEPDPLEMPGENKRIPVGGATPPRIPLLSRLLDRHANPDPARVAAKGAKQEAQREERRAEYRAVFDALDRGEAPTTRSNS